MSQVRIAIDLARKYHNGQKYGDQPYMYHLEHVASKVNRYFRYKEGVNELVLTQLFATAYLHDIIEDTEATEETLLKAGIAPLIVRSVVLLSKHEDIPYEMYIQGIKQNEVARIVKLCDTVSNLEHSIQEGRLKNINKYTKQIQLLGGFNVVP